MSIAFVQTSQLQFFTQVSLALHQALRVSLSLLSAFSNSGVISVRALNTLFMIVTVLFVLQRCVHRNTESMSFRRLHTVHLPMALHLAGSRSLGCEIYNLTLPFLTPCVFFVGQRFTSAAHRRPLPPPGFAPRAKCEAPTPSRPATLGERVTRCEPLALQYGHPL